MPLSRRQLVKRDLRQAIGSLQRAQIYLARLGQLYEPSNRIIYGALCELIAGIDKVREVVVDLSKRI